jgi:DNA-binding NarL/FixJ family response regulator
MMYTQMNIKVALMDSDFYALQAINSYLAWDRRTRVVATAETPKALREWLSQAAPAEQPDATLFEVDWAPNVERLQKALRGLDETAGVVLCLSARAERERIVAAGRTGARGYLVKGDVRLGIAGAVAHALTHQFVVSASVAEQLAGPSEGIFLQAEVLPGLRRYPELTDRVEQALRLCVIEGMSADLAADEMGVSAHTIRSYVKEGYRILEAHDDTHFPVNMSPQERAFMRYTALRREADEEW